MKPAAVLFDCDGVIVDSEPIGLALLQAELGARGLAVTMDDIHREFVGRTLTQIAEIARPMGAALPDTWAGDFYEVLYARLAEGTPLIPGIEAVLDALDAAAIGYAVGSNGTLRKMNVTLRQHPGVWARVEGRLFSGQELGCPKPEPGVYLHAAAALGVAPGACVVVDDSASGCKAGLAAGMRTLGFAGESDGAPLAALGVEVFHRMEALPGLIGLPATSA